MGDILDRIIAQIEEADVNHDWSKKIESSDNTVEEYYDNIVDQIQHPFLQDGFKLIKQQYPYKGIRYGGESSLDKKFSIPTAIGTILSTATIDKSQEAIDLLVSETWYGNGGADSDTSSGAQPCGSAGAVGTFNGDYWMGEVKPEWLANTTASGLVNEGEYGLKIIETANKYAPKYSMAPARCIAQVMIEGGWRKNTKDVVNAWGCKGIGQFAKGSWDAPYARAIEKYPELKAYSGAWADSSSTGGPGHPILGVIVMMEYMKGIHDYNMETALPGKDEDYWWSAIGYLMGPGRAAKILKACNGDRSKCDEEAEKVGIGSYSKANGGKGVAFYGNVMLEKWLEYSKAVPKSEIDESADTTPDVETNSNSCTSPTLSGDITSKVAWTPGQELTTPVEDFRTMNASAYGVPAGKAGAEWQKGDGTQGIHLEMDAAIKGCNAAMQREAGLTPVTYGGYRSSAKQAELRAKYEAGKGAQAAKPGNSAHECGYAIDLSQRGEPRKWWHQNAMRFGLAPYGNYGATEDWHFQIHPDLAYILAQKNAARGGTWD